MTASEGARPSGEEQIPLGVMHTIRETFSSVALRHRLPFLNLVLVYDKPSSQVYGAVVGVKYEGDSYKHHARCERILPFSNNVGGIVDTVLSLGEDFALVCDQPLSEQLRTAKGSVTWVEEGHYRLQGRPQKTVDVFTAYKISPASIPEDQLPPDTLEVFRYEE